MKKPGYALATILILLGVAMFSAAAIVTTSTLESKISVSQRDGISAYYVAEAGVEDALWRIQTNDAACGTPKCSDALQAGTLNYTYTATNAPQSGQSFTITMVSTSGQPAGNVTVTSVGKVTDGFVTAQRKVVITAYQGPPNSAIGTSALLSGGGLSVHDGNSKLIVTSGDLYAASGISLSKTTVTMSGGNLLTQGSYSSSNATLTGDGSIQASNYLPKPSAIAVPGFDFTYYKTHNNAYYNESTSNTFENAVSGGQTTFNGPVTYIDGNINFNSWAKNQHITVTGMLIINGSVAFNGNLGTFSMTILDPGNGQSGLFISGGSSILDGTWNIQGTVYTPGSLKFNDTNPITVDGALVAGGGIDINTAANVTLSFNNTRATAVFGAGTPSVVQTRHQEEEY